MKITFSRLRILPILLTLSLIVFLNSNIKAQGGKSASNENKKRSLNYSLTAGYTTFSLDEVKEVYSDILNFYRNSNIPIPTQSEYPGDLTFGIQIYYSIFYSFDVGLGATYASTDAVSSYEDYAGSLDINSNVSMISYEIMVRKSFKNKNTLQPYIELRSGITQGSYEIKDDVLFFDELSFLKQKTVLSVNGSNRSYSGSIGGKLSWNKLAISAQVGYRYSNITEPKGKITSNGTEETLGKLNIDIDLSGLIIKTNIELPFP